jgi:hypothetical protein
MPDESVFVMRIATPYFSKCRAVLSGPQDFSVCRIGRDKTGPPQYLLYGDSTALRLTWQFEELAPGGLFISGANPCYVLLKDDQAYVDEAFSAKKPYECAQLPYRMLDVVKNTTSITRVYLSISLNPYRRTLSGDFSHTVRSFLSMGVSVFYVETPPHTMLA